VDTEFEMDRDTDRHTEKECDKATGTEKERGKECDFERFIVRDKCATNITGNLATDK
jgi:hypothetical protein